MPQATVTSIVESFLEDGYTARDFSNLLPYVGRQKVASITDLHSMLNMLLLADAVSDKGRQRFMPASISSTRSYRACPRSYRGVKIIQSYAEIKSRIE